MDVRESYSADVRIWLEVDQQVVHVRATDSETVTVGCCTKLTATLVTSVDGKETRRPVVVFIPRVMPYTERPER